MVTQITRGIKISVSTSFEGTYFKNYKIHFAFSYEITIENHSNDSVQLNTRHWEILDSLNDKEIVDGEGVVGKKPVLKPGEKHTYNSGCLLSSPFGAMSGYFKCSFCFELILDKSSSCQKIKKTFVLLCNSYFLHQKKRIVSTNLKYIHYAKRFFPSSKSNK